MIRVVTSFSPSGYELYGRKFVGSFRKFWPKSVELLIYHEGGLGEGINLLELPSCKTFLERHKDNKFVHGRAKYPGHFWKPKAEREGYNYRFDAGKFCRKAFAIADAARNAQSGRLFWIDADVESLREIQERWLERLLPDDISICHLARPGYYSECGFVGYNLNRPETHLFVTALETVYTSDAFFLEKEWHDSWIFDRVLKRLRPATKQIPHSNHGQPFDHSELGIYMVHRKGSRKYQGR